MTPNDVAYAIVFVGVMLLLLLFVSLSWAIVHETSPMFSLVRQNLVSKKI